MKALSPRLSGKFQTAAASAYIQGGSENAMDAREAVVPTQMVDVGEGL